MPEFKVLRRELRDSHEFREALTFGENSEATSALRRAELLEFVQHNLDCANSTGVMGDCSMIQAIDMPDLASLWNSIGPLLGGASSRSVEDRNSRPEDSAFQQDSEDFPVLVAMYANNRPRYLQQVLQGLIWSSRSVVSRARFASRPPSLNSDGFENTEQHGFCFRSEGGGRRARDSFRERHERLLAAKTSKTGLQPTGLTMPHGLLPKKRPALLLGGEADDTAAHASGGRMAGAEAPPAPSTNSGSFADAARSTRTRIVDMRGRGGEEKEGGGYSPPSSRP